MDYLKNRFVSFIIVLTILFSPANVFAEEDLVISSWIVEANLLEDGSLSVVKDITYNFNTDFNGIYVDIVLDNIIKIEDLQVSEIIAGEEVKYIQDQRAKKGQYGVYSTDLTDDYINIMIFSPSEDESKTFRLKYTLVDAAAVHLDTGELYYKLIGDNNETPIDYFRANINLPRFNQEDIKIFAHGPLNGNINFDNESIKLEVSNIPSNTFVEARLLFPLDYVPQATRAGSSSLDNILDEEQALADRIIEDEIKREERKSLFNNISIGLSAATLLILGFVLNKFRRKPDLFEKMDSIYPDEISPAELSLFMNSVIVPRAYIATLLDLTRKGFITFEAIVSDKGSKKKSKIEGPDNYIFTKNNTNLGSLMEHEKFFMEWFFNEIGNGSKVSTNDIDNYREKNAIKFSKSQTSWSKIVREDLNARDYYDPKGKRFGIPILFISIILLAVSIMSLVLEGLYGIPLLILSIILIIYSIFLFQRTSDEGYIQYRLWKDFKKNNSKMDLNNLGLSTDLSMIYLIALGLPMKELDSYRESIDVNYYPLHWGYFYFLMNNKGGSTFEDKFNNSFYGTTGSSTSNSTSFGGGGGFTGGGGGGVGGSGSGGF
ncbi:MAG: DUF2207 domain-containing protein [Tissierella sp.]|nr:DUF2207 domain-containing protein [Tissierella sp.]